MNGTELPTSTSRVTTVTLVFAFDGADPGATVTGGMMKRSLRSCPGSPQHCAAARATRADNVRRGIAEMIPSAGRTDDIDRWESLGIQWTVVDQPVMPWFADWAEAQVTARLNDNQLQFVREHLLLDECESDDEDGLTYTLDGGGWRDARGCTPYVAVGVEIW